GSGGCAWIVTDGGRETAIEACATECRRYDCLEQAGDQPADDQQDQGTHHATRYGILHPEPDSLRIQVPLEIIGIGHASRPFGALRRGSDLMFWRMFPQVPHHGVHKPVAVV
ncbi:MAG TPA: hypothetical protein VK356_00320, partial [Thermomicrobiales bacterium]|nr:hypothetical protein [Thermomicrobiales bacterium]